MNQSIAKIYGHALILGGQKLEVNQSSFLIFKKKDSLTFLK
jgi:hypothetical protein